MNRNDLYEAVGKAEETALEHSQKEKRVPRRHWWMGAAAAVLALVLIVGVTVHPFTDGGTASATAIAEAEYPKMHKYPGEPATEAALDRWREDVQAQQREPGFSEGLEPCMKDLLRELLSGAGKENRAASPVNVYMALAMLSELTDGESRQQILDVLGADSLDAVREQAGDVWNAYYRNDTATTSVLASSLWLNEDVPFNKSTLENLAKNYYASAYRGEMGTEKMDKAIRSWVNDQTGGLLSEQTKSIHTTAQTCMELLTTVFYQAKWGNEFRVENTKPGTFHSTGGDVKRDFMYATDHNGICFWGEHFSAVSKYMENDGGTMWFILPDEGCSPEDLLKEDEVLTFILDRDKWNEESRPNQKQLVVHLSLPKFDISSQTDIGKSLQRMGITDVFDPDTADFSTMVEQQAEPIWISKVNHAVRVAADEEGVTAAAYTEMVMCGSAMPPEEEMDFVLDRPFLFVLTGADSLPLFAGIVNQP